MGGSPGLVVMGGDSRTRDCGFKSNLIMDNGWTFFTLYYRKCNVCLKRAKISDKRAEDGPFFIKIDCL